jgi:hypothetical protein
VCVLLIVKISFNDHDYVILHLVDRMNKLCKMKVRCIAVLGCAKQS